MLSIRTRRWWTVWGLALFLLACGFRSSIADEPAVPGRGPFLEGLSALDGGRSADAINAFGLAIEQDSENADYYIGRGVAYILAENPPKAIKDLERAQRLSSDSKRARMWLATAVAMTGDFPRSSEIYPAATNDLDESRVRKASHDYGQPVFRQLRGDPDPDGRRQQEAALKELLVGARWFVRTMKSQPGMSADLLANARARVERREYADALPDLSSALAASPEDPQILFYHATCLLNLGNLSTAREEFTRALTIKTDLGEAYLGRALAAAQLGDARRAKSDLEIAIRLLPALASQRKAEIERQAVQNNRSTAKGTLKALIEAAQKGASDDELVAQAAELIKSSNGQRLRYDEWYQDRLRQLEDALRAAPKQSDRLVDLARFLYDESSVRRERVGPRGDYFQYRYQTPESQKRELARSAELADAALASSPNHVEALLMKARVLMWHKQYADAEKLIRKTLEHKPIAPELLELFAEVLEVAAAQKSAEAAELRRPKYLGSDEERVGDYIYTYSYYRQPSQAELDKANTLDQLATQLAAQALEQIQKAAHLKKGTALGFYLQGLYHWHANELDKAKENYDQALRMDPKNVRWHFNQAGICSALGKYDEAADHHVIAVNLRQTSAAPLLNAVWEPIVQTKYQTSRKILERAAALDEADSRVAAYLGVVNLADEKPEAALADFRAALAIEEAKATLAGTSFGLDGQGPLAPLDVGLTLTLRRRADAILMQQERYAEALDLARASVACERRIAPSDYTQEVASSLLPSPDLDPNLVPEAENALALFAWAHVDAGAALNKLGRPDEAIALLDPIGTYETLLTNGVGSQRLQGPKLYSMLEMCRAYMAKGDIQQAQRCAQMLPRKRHGAGPSKGPFPELEEEGSRLQEQLAQMRSGQQAAGDESADEYSPPDEEKVNEVLRRIGPQFGHPEMGNGQRRFAGDAGDVQLCIVVEQAVRQIVTPKSKSWRSNVLIGIAMIQQVQEEFTRQMQAIGRRPPRGRGEQMARQLQERLKRTEQAISAVKGLAVESGYPEKELDRDLALGPEAIFRRAR